MVKPAAQQCSRAVKYVGPAGMGQPAGPVELGDKSEDRLLRGRLQWVAAEGQLHARTRSPESSRAMAREERRG